MARRRVLLRNGRLCIETADGRPSQIAAIVDAWYRERAAIHLHEIFEARWKDFRRAGMQKPVLALRRMEKRWGSLSPSGRLTLNTRLIQAPKAGIEYVITHELCHLVHPHHGPAFQRLLECAMPDWAGRKQRLELAMA